MTLMWGLLGPGALPNERRTRTFGVAASVRLFNELAVPGIGGVWFCKQLLLATLGIRIAEQAQSHGKEVGKIEAANAVEALACWLAFDAGKWERDPRLRGSTKMQNKVDLSFQAVRQRSFYVTQPMRMRTVQALPQLGFVATDSSRFNAFACSQAGKDFVDAACDGFSPFKRGVIDHLVRWVVFKEDRVKSVELHDALSPITSLPPRALELLMERLLQGGDHESAEHKQRRRDALAWVESQRKTRIGHTSWSSAPPEISSDAHWRDLRAGAMFQAAREAAIAALDALEAHISRSADGERFCLSSSVPSAVLLRLTELRHAANSFLEERHQDRDANAFCGECNSDDPIKVLTALVARDGRVLRLKERDVVPGPAFQRGGAPQQEHEDNAADTADSAPAIQGGLAWPPGISARLQNLFLLNADLRGELDQWLDKTATEEDPQ